MLKNIEQTKLSMEQTLDFFCNGTESSQSHRPKEAIPDSCDKCEPGLSMSISILGSYVSIFRIASGGCMVNFVFDNMMCEFQQIYIYRIYPRNTPRYEQQELMEIVSSVHLDLVI